ncbi:hypothetical protein GCM10010967_44790 [Dyadobacter beijingensis]|uniref:Uncharacterized protein n=1 Tax=Dyadobacter beijingensis TaxID=365489 RepID=A0ABQ2I9X4_9BACT|nr:hypothetical protein [Dyadobacter beijingensis]GGN04804.1 hypothetical protein GCM10010967_44790 [Dyadobacter beijingensis]
MIHTDFNWTELVNLLLICAALALLAVQCAWLYMRHRHSGRIGIRLLLNVLLWVVVSMWVLGPYFKSPAKSNVGLLVADNVPGEVTGWLRDSLLNARIVAQDRIRESQADTLVILGQAFDASVPGAIRQLRNVPKVKWIPYFAPDELSGLRWKGIVKKGEMQRVEGLIQSVRKQILQIRYGGRTLDSVALVGGDSRFRLAFPAFSEGRTTTTLHLNGRVIDTVRFFSQPEAKLTIRFLLDSPDFETRNLATWLGKNGHSVSYDATLSKNITTSLNINRAKEPDLIVTSPANASGPVVKKAIGNGKSVLFVQMTDPEAEVRGLNEALGTRFQVVRMSNEASVALSPVLNALPFRFQIQSFQTQAAHYPVAAEKTTGKVVVSLLNETFPMQLSGDSVAYAKVWDEIMAWTRPAQGPVMSADAPAFKSIPTKLYLNNFQAIPRRLIIGSDTVFTKMSSLNGHSANATFLPATTGWQPLHDSLHTEIYVQDYSLLRHAAGMQHFVQTAGEATFNTTFEKPQHATRKLPDWVWFTLLMLCLTALWIEPKL